MHIPAPKMPLPGHAESYRPPKEYLLTEEEQKQWEVRGGWGCVMKWPHITYHHSSAWFNKHISIWYLCVTLVSQHGIK